MQTLSLPHLLSPPPADHPYEIVDLIPCNPAEIKVFQFENVKNGTELRQGIIKTTMKNGVCVPDACFLDARMIIDFFQIQLACTLALQSQQQNKMKTRSLYAEVLYNLSPMSNISDTLKTFGVASDTTDVIVVAFQGYPQTTPKSYTDETFLETISNCIQGNLISLNPKPDKEKIATVFKCNQDDLLSNITLAMTLKQVQ